MHNNNSQCILITRECRSEYVLDSFGRLKTIFFSYVVDYFPSRANKQLRKVQYWIFWFEEIQYITNLLIKTDEDEHKFPEPWFLYLGILTVPISTLWIVMAMLIYKSCVY